MGVRVLRDGRWLPAIVVDASTSGGLWVDIDMDRAVWINLLTNSAGIRLDDLSSMATAGVLLGMLDSADYNPHVHLSGGAKADLSDAYGVALRDGRRFAGATLGEAVARALLAVWSAE